MFLELYRLDYEFRDYLMTMFWKPITVQSEIISSMLIENHYKQTFYFNPEKTGNMALPSKTTFTDDGNLQSIRVFKMRPILFARY